jgi:protein-disulfide isomerase
MATDPVVVRLPRPVNDEDHSKGPANAPVTLVEYGDYQCPDCLRAFSIIAEIQKRMDGRMRFVFRHFPLGIHPRALRAAEASEAAAAQGKFWEMYDTLFKHQQALEDRDLQQYAGKIGLDAARFEREMDEHKYAPRIQQEFHEALYGGGITGTPTFYINEVRHNDTANLERMLAAIQRAASTE